MKKISIVLVLMLVLSSLVGFSSLADIEIDELTIYKAATINSMDYTVNTAAASFAVYGYVGEGLYKYYPDGSLGMGLAESEDISEDGLTRTFHIRQNAKYSNGIPITAYDFEYSWKRLADPNTGAEYATMIESAMITNASAVINGELPVDELGVKALDEYTFQVTFDIPVSYFPSLMTFATFFPLNQEFVESCGDQFGLTPENTLCSGPYMLTVWTPGGNVETIERNPYYYDTDLLTVDKMTWQIITEASSGIMGYEMGTLDVMELTSEYVESYMNDPGFLQTFGATIYWLQFNCREGAAFDNVNLRKAISLCVDKKAICDNILKNGSEPAHFFYPEYFMPMSTGGNIRAYAKELGYGDDGEGYYQFEDDAKALEYWEAFKEETGVDSYEVTMIFTNTDTYNYVAAFLKQEIETALPGLTWNLQPLESNDRIAKSKSGDYDVVMGGWGADYQDASNFAMLVAGDSPFNYGGWVNEDYDALNYQYQYVDAADELQRAKDLLDMEAIYFEDCVECTLWQSATCYLIKSTINVPMNVTGSFMYQYSTAK